MLAIASRRSSGTFDSPIVLDHGSNLNLETREDHGADVTSDACSSATDVALAACADNAAASTRRNFGIKGSSPSHREAQREACCEGIPVEFPRGRNHHISYPFGIHSEPNYLGTIARPGTSFIYKQSHVANLQSVREALARTAGDLPPYPSTSVSWTGSNMGSMRTPHLSITESEDLSK